MDTPYNLVKHIIEKFGPRKAGTEAETKAQLYFSEHIKSFCDKVEVEEFTDALTAKFASLRLFCLGYYAALVVPKFSPEIALAVAFINGFLFLFHFVMYYNWLDFLFPKQQSRTVIGSIEPTGEVKRTLLFAGHMDSTPEFIWWYWLKDWGIRLMVLGGVSFAILPVYYLVSIILGYDIWMSPVWWFFVATSPFSLTFFFIHGSRIVDGAQDNLSGVAVAHEVAKRLSQDRLRHTRVKLISFGSEETGLKGSDAFAKRHKDELLAENAFLINLDGILDIDNMYIIKKELSLAQNHHEGLINRLGGVFEKHDLEKKLGVIPIGASDAASFSRLGLPAVSIVGLPMDSLHPTYHTRLDTIDCLSNDTLTKMAKVLVDMAKEWDGQ